MNPQSVTLYGVPHSLYAGRARSYLIKANVAYREQPPGSPHFLSAVLPKAGGRFGMPTLELGDGTVIRDGAAIIDHFEQSNGHSYSPVTPRQRFVSRLFDVIGAEGLLRPAMHYRWNFDDENLEFLLFHMKLLAPDAAVADQVAQKIAGDMRRATKQFGVNADTETLIEELYTEQLAALDRHFSRYPYLLGGRPCIGDFGLIGPLFGHLSRDPRPRRLMESRAMNVLRWVERMKRRDADLVGFPEQDATYLGGDEIPDTLIELLRTIAVDFVPETQAAAAVINRWIDAQEELTSGTECARGAGFAEFEVRGTRISALAQPYRFYLLKRAQDEYAAMNDEDQQSLRALLDDCGMSSVLGAVLDRSIGRESNLEV